MLTDNYHAGRERESPRSPLQTNSKQQEAESGCVERLRETMWHSLWA